MKCFYCNQPLSEDHYRRAKTSGRYQVTWAGGIACRKCFKLTPAEMRKFDREKLARRKRKRVAILTVSFELKVKANPREPIKHVD